MQCMSSTQFDTHPGGTDGLLSLEPSMLHEFKTSCMCIFGCAVLGSKKRRLGHHLYVLRREAVGTWYPAFAYAGHHPWTVSWRNCTPQDGVHPQVRECTTDSATVQGHPDIPRSGIQEVQTTETTFLVVCS